MTLDHPGLFCSAPIRQSRVEDVCAAVPPIRQSRVDDVCAAVPPLGANL